MPLHLDADGLDSRPCGDVREVKGVVDVRRASAAGRIVIAAHARTINANADTLLVVRTADAAARRIALRVTRNHSAYALHELARHVHPVVIDRDAGERVSRDGHIRTLQWIGVAYRNSSGRGVGQRYGMVDREGIVHLDLRAVDVDICGRIPG